MRYCAVALVLFLACCSSDDVVRPGVVSDYFPLKTGAWLIYAIDSVIIAHDDSVVSKYQLRVRVTDSFVGGSGENTFVLQRAKRSDSSAAWTPLETWSAIVSSYQAIVTEGNVPFLKLLGPLHNDLQWNGNAFNARAGTEHCPGTTTNTCDIYSVEKFAASFEDFPNTLTVNQNHDEDTVVFTDIRSEVYGLHIGLIDRQIRQIQYCNSNCSPGEIVSKGVHYSQRLISHGGF